MVMNMALLISSSAATGIFVGWGLSYLFFTQNSRKQKLESRHTNNAIEDYPLAIRTELTSRVRTFFGEDGFKRLENSYVIVSIYILILLLEVQIVVTVMTINR